MITTKKLLKLLAADEKETEKIIESMSEKDAKDFVRVTVSFLKKSGHNMQL